MTSSFLNFRQTNPKNPTSLRKLLDSLNIKIPTEQTPINKAIVQRTAIFESRPKVMLVASLEETSIIKNYNHLPPFQLNKKEESIVKQISSQLHHDGDNILVTDYHYEKAKNILFLECVRTPYSVIRALSAKKIERNPFYFKTGVMSPIICNDDAVIFLQRNDAHKLFSSPGGFLQPIPVNETKNLMLSTEENMLDLVELTAIKESREELLYDSTFDNIDLNLSQRLGFSVRYPINYSLPTAEFILPVNVPCSKNTLIQIIKNNNSPDAQEHTGAYWVFDYSNTEMMEKSLRAIATDNKPGCFLYLPVLDVIFPALKTKIRSCLDNHHEAKGPSDGQQTSFWVNFDRWRYCLLTTDT